MEAAEIPIAQHSEDKESAQNRLPEPVSRPTPVLMAPDPDFIRELIQLTGGSFKKCFQCGTCSAICPLSPDEEPFPRKEMAWALWGWKDRLLQDTDLWLCHQCNDCSELCPRGGRPGDVLSAVRSICIREHSAPRFMGRLLSEPRFLSLLILLPVLLLGGLILLREPLEGLFGLGLEAGRQIVYPFSSFLPHWLLNGFFALFGVLVLLVSCIGVIRFWKTLTLGSEYGRRNQKASPLARSVGKAFRKALFHTEFASCESQFSRALPHVFVLFGFLALSVVTAWVITGTSNPLVREDFIYPFEFWSPWKLLGNLGGLALLVGCVLMALNRYREHIRFGAATYVDWFFLGILFFTVLSGFASEILHYLRMVPHRHYVYFVHLVSVCCLLFYLPYSKFAHFLYRLAAMVFAERFERGGSSWK